MCQGCPDWDECSGCDITRDGIASTCEAPLDHTTADEDGVTLETLDVDEGFWRASNESDKILACFNEDACSGGQTGAEGYCAPGYKGPCERGGNKSAPWWYCRVSKGCEKFPLESARFLPVALTLEHCVRVRARGYLSSQIALCAKPTILHRSLTPVRNARAQDARGSWPPASSPCWFCFLPS